MINTVADLLNQLMLAEAKKIAEQNIPPHRVTIGDIHEGLSADILRKGVFEGLNLNVVTGSFIENPEGNFSKEMDVMLIEGQAEPIPYTTRFKVLPEQVIAVIQVKKTLNKQQIASAYENLRDVYDIAEWNDYPLYVKEMFRNAFMQICKKDVVDNGKIRTTFSSKTEEQIFHMLALEAAMPVRSVLGYEGYKSEFNLREGFIEFLNDNVSTLDNFKYGFSPLAFPNLIINKGVSLIKGNALPYVGPMIDGQWAFYFSDATNPIMHLLEMIWTRLTYRFDISSDIFGEDLEIDGLNTVLLANMVNINGLQAWNFEYVPTRVEALENATGKKDWEPVPITFHQHALILYLINVGDIYFQEIKDLLGSGDDAFDVDGLVQYLIDSHLVVKDSTGKITFATVNCKTLYIKGKGFFAADDKSGRFTRWRDRLEKEQDSSPLESE